jgi:4-oxalocrotonate tautomerase
MPLARIDLIKGQPSQYRQTIGDVVYSAMVDVLRAPKDERFQVIAEHDEANFVYHPTFFGIDRSKDVIFVQLTLRKEDVFVSLVGTGREDWSFGNGEVSLVDTHSERLPFASLDHVGGGGQQRFRMVKPSAVAPFTVLPHGPAAAALRTSRDVRTPTSR